MKYIKTYEGIIWNSSDPEYHMKKSEFKFKLGDKVRLSWYDDIYYITGIKDNFQDKLINAYYLDFDDGKHFGWVKEDELELVPDYELDAMKYNL